MNHDDLNAAPAFTAPPLSCDAHFHVFGKAGQYPYIQDLRYAPPEAPLQDYLALARHLGIQRHVFVQPSAYGRDNACMLDAMRQVGADCRGIVDVDENIPDAQLEAMHLAGVRGIRINVNPIKPPEPGFARSMEPRIRTLAARCAELGWHLDFLLPGWLTQELMPLLASLRIDFTLAHLGMNLAKHGAQAEGFRQLIDLLRNGQGKCWVKLTGIYRISSMPDYSDVAPMAAALAEAAPDRLIWGSDYPHLSFSHCSSVQLFNLLDQWLPDAALKQQVLARNPERLFGFA